MQRRGRGITPAALASTAALSVKYKKHKDPLGSLSSQASCLCGQSIYGHSSIATGEQCNKYCRPHNMPCKQPILFAIESILGSDGNCIAVVA